jgi:hypothetical protein
MLADLKAWLNISTSTDDVLLQRLLTAVSVTMQNWMNRTIPQASYTDTRDGNGSDTLSLAYKPVTAVTSVTVNGQAVLPSPDGIQPGFVFSDTAVYLIGSRFTQGRRNVQVAYTAGYATIPADLAQACIEQAAYQYRAKSHIGQTGTGMGPEHISFSERDFTPGTKALMQQYKSVVPL